MNNEYINTVQLLLLVAPAIFESPCFAMKGGTALNLFVQSMPRLSVDIDVVFVPYQLPRDEALQRIADELAAAKARLEALGLRADLRKTKDGNEAKLFVSNGEHEVKIEVNFVFRGTALPPVRTSLTEDAQKMFAANIDVPILATPELYGSKLVAALDRQHPRDLFDVQLMFARFGLPPEFLDCFVIYLAGHNRPAHEVLFPNEQDIDAVFEAEFVGMTNVPVTLDELKATRKKLMAELPRALSEQQRGFLLSLVQAKPDWDLLPFGHVRELPAIQWKLMNLARLQKNRVKFQQQHDELFERLARLG
ncbi:nucleotidyl transferase AbiEii/AbiGii toxin family protein [Paraburkholderia adhaesiva]|uniref:nucleotidyl transferase AbiEii/AbiGii toxin family protein n=1 Tax=Paraburkholderia adhaesiva TaxID=2883244 RepID=UPI001F3FDBEB|nr:nucleotidyl transferase AbiEii/AbiGii toxin family protein [Paraburkholderia adhaesiva]